jgi:hypothetical protein
MRKLCLKVSLYKQTTVSQENIEPVTPVFPPDYSTVVFIDGCLSGQNVYQQS